MTTQDDRYLWFDLETTGLDPARHAIIEVAAVLTDSRLTIIREVHEVVRPVPPDCWDPVCVAMHEKSGLIAILRADDQQIVRNLADVTDRICGMVGVHGRFGAVGGVRTSNVVLAGRSVHFDRAFMKVQMPALDRRLSHRHLDVSAVERFCTAAWGDTFKQPGESNHRAHDDVHASLKHYRKLLDVAQKFRTFRAPQEPLATATNDLDTEAQEVRAS